MSLPLLIVDNESFMNFMLDVDPKYKMINRRDITRSFLPIMYKKCIKKLQDICNRSKYISLPLDIWSDRRMRSYFGITLHTIIDDQYKTYVLSFERLKGKHSGDKLAAEFDRVVQMYNLKDKLVRIVTDNASNNQAAFDNLILPGFEEYFNDIDDDQSERETSDEDSDNNELYENSQLQAEEVDDDIYGTTLNAPAEQEFLRLPSDLAKLAHTSTSFAERLEEQKYSIPLANRARWNSQFQTVKKVISIPSFILNSILTDLKNNNLILNTKDRKILEDFVSLFELFNEATVLTQGEFYATVSLVAPTILGILFDLEREHASSNLSLVSVCEALLSSLKARFSGLLRHFEIDVSFTFYSMSERFSDPVFLIAPLLDARFKLLWLDNLQLAIKLRVIEKIYSTFVRFFSKLNFSVSQPEGADESSVAEQDITDMMTKHVDPTTKRKCLFPYLNDTKKISFDDKSKVLKNLYPSLYELSLKYFPLESTGKNCRIQLSGLDLWITLRITRLFVYPKEINIDKLKESVSRALSIWPIMSGRYIVIDNDKHFIEMSDNPIPFCFIKNDLLDKSPFDSNMILNVIDCSYLSFIDPIDVDKLVGGSLDEPLLRLKLTHIEKSNEWIIGVSGSHIVGDGDTFLKFFNQISRFYQDIYTIEFYPIFERHLWNKDDFNQSILSRIKYVSECRSCEETQKKIFDDQKNLYQINLEFSSEQINKLRCLADDGNQITNQDALIAYIISTLNRYCYPKTDQRHILHATTVINFRGVSDSIASKDFAGNGFFLLTSDDFEDSESILNIAKTIRQSINQSRDPIYLQSCLSTVDHLMRQLINDNKSSNVFFFNNDIFINSNYRYDWINLVDFGYKDQCRYYSPWTGRLYISVSRLNPFFDGNNWIRTDKNGAYLAFLIENDMKDLFINAYKNDIQQSFQYVKL
ncbi:unnamed protein product [Rotaria sordida]|uniref:Uncharacterized protein n=1 Tax=Rotaria sordida TaxID=392033 RepID=A0A814MGG9_9BILA|nr:unnamed protein product [Rotaria sordida]CAF1268425.1 unnamed protein product [Rotaria sordida]